MMEKWKHLTHHSLVEFKSVSDPFQPGDFEVLLSYTLLYCVKFKISYEKRLSSWLVVPAINRHLKRTLAHYGIVLNPQTSGFWQAETMFPMYVVEYNYLPFELPYSTLKLFIKSGKPVQEVFRAMLESEQVEQVRKAGYFLHCISLKVHWPFMLYVRNWVIKASLPVLKACSQ